MLFHQFAVHSLALATPHALDADLVSLLVLAASIGVFHTLLGPDHYLPFMAMGKAGQWSFRKTMLIGTACGVGHVLGSVVVGLLGVALGWAIGGIEWFESQRGSLAGWLLLGFGLAYMAWGIRRAIRNRPHTHWHVHDDGTAHSHEHSHHSDHAHAHTDDAGVNVMTPWIIFTIFVFGPCEPLIPILMYPAAEHHWLGVVLIALVFGACTVGTMMAIVAAGYLGLSVLPGRALARYSHALAGFALAACGALIQIGL